MGMAPRGCFERALSMGPWGWNRWLLMCYDGCNNICFRVVIRPRSPWRISPLSPYLPSSLSATRSMPLGTSRMSLTANVLEEILLKLNIWFHFEVTERLNHLADGERMLRGWLNCPVLAATGVQTRRQHRERE